MTDKEKGDFLSSKTSRRNFLKSGLKAGLAGIVTPPMFPSGVMSVHGKPGANDRIVLGGIGVGSRAGGLLNTFDGYDDVIIGAVADVDMNRCEQIANQYEADAYTVYRQLLDRTVIDGIVIASPDHWHALHSIHAAQAGKDIYCEKSLSLTIREGGA